MTTKKDSEIVQHSFYMSKSQSNDLADLAKSLECTSVPEFFSKLIELGRVVSDAVNNGLEIVMYDPKQTQVVENKLDGRTMFLFKNNAAFELIKERIQEIMELQKEMAKTNWGLLTEPGKA